MEGLRVVAVGSFVDVRVTGLHVLDSPVRFMLKQTPPHQQLDCIFPWQDVSHASSISFATVVLHKFLQYVLAE